MIDREKVIKSLECCGNHNMNLSCADCEYAGYGENGDRKGCVSMLTYDAWMLMKEWEKVSEKDSAKVITTVGSVEELKKRLSAGETPEIGQIVLDVNGMSWRCIHQTKDHVVLMMTRAYDRRPFARPCEQYEDGWNNYEHSQIRRELNTEVLNALFGEAKDLLSEYWQGMGKLFLLSEEEVGFNQTARTFDWFKGENKEELNSRRSMLDLEGTETPWWLRCSCPSFCNFTRRVLTDGSLGYNFAVETIGLVAACAILKRPETKEEAQ